MLKRALPAGIIMVVAILVLPFMVRGTPSPPPPFYPLGIDEQDAAKLPPEKKALWDEAKREHDDALAKPIPTGDNPKGILRPVTPTNPWGVGIFEGDYPPFSKLEYGFLNRWQGLVNGERIRIYAGVLVNDRTQGVVLVEHVSSDGKRLSTKPYLTSIKSGYLRVAKAVGTQLTLVSQGGDSWTFDAADPASADGLYNPDAPRPPASVRLDMDPAIPGVQSSLTIAGAQDINIDVVLGDNVGNVSAFNFTLIYDDTTLTSAGAKDGALDGNPDFNQAALGTSWTCSSAGSPSPDVDPAAGAGHGAALLSCYALAGGTALTAATVIGTLHLHAAAAVAASIALADVYFAHDDGAEIGSCNPIITVEMTCAGGSVVTP